MQTLDVRPWPDIDALRDAIRNGDIRCECRIGNSLHYEDCLWYEAVGLIYTRERELEKDSESKRFLA